MPKKNPKAFTHQVPQSVNPPKPPIKHGGKVETREQKLPDPAS